MLEISTSVWIGFSVLIAVAMAVDLGLFQGTQALSTRQAGIRTAMWIALALGFGVWIHVTQGSEAALLYVTGYLIEYSLSIDNIFVFIMIFSYFGVPKPSQKRVLFWGILGAITMRALMIFTGVALIERYHWIIYLFGAFLIFTAFKMLFSDDEEVDPGKNPVVRWARKVLPVTESYEGSRFLVVRDGKHFVTPLFIVLLLVESSDVMFAVDSIPAIMAITHDPFIILTSNVFAISGLRSLYFLVMGIIDRFRYLKPAIAVILGFVGLKMLMTDIVQIPTVFSLGFIVIVLFGAGVLSALAARADAKRS